MKNIDNKTNTSYLFDYKKTVLNQIKNSNLTFLFLDFDGTLVNFKTDPQKVKINGKVQKIIQYFQDNKKFEVVLITGRKLKDIKEKVNIKKINFAAVHGLHLQFQDGTEKIIKKAIRIETQLNEIKKEAEKLFSDKNGVFLEDKKFTVAFHYRAVSKQKRSQLKNKFLSLVEKYNFGNIETIEGDNVIEVRPTKWNKGDAVKVYLKRKSNTNSIFPIYIGDDTTDEDAFQYLNQKGLTIYVKNDSNLKTNASYWIKNPEDVIRFLSMIIKEIQ